MLKGFKDFLMRGNVVDLAVAVVVGAAFTAIVTAFSSNIIEPLINSLGGTDAAEGLGFTIKDGNPETFVNIGGLITAIINFLIIASIVYFVIVMPYEKLKAYAARDGDDAIALSESELLTEIRDILQGKDPVEEKAKIAAAKSEHSDKDEAFIERASEEPTSAGVGVAGLGVSAAGTQKFSAQPEQSGPPPSYAQGPPPGYQPPAGPPPRQNDPLSGPLPGSHQQPAGPPPGYNPNQPPQRPGPPQYGPPDYGPAGPGYRPDPLTGPPPGYRPPPERSEDGPGRHSQ
ncbi:UNVERIFIED_CONTAM: large conductance mechanosensitive channel [Williamsia faeni]